MALYLFVCISVCMWYAVVIVTGKIWERGSWNLVELYNNRYSQFSPPNTIQLQELRTLSAKSTNAIKKSRLESYKELYRTAKEQSSTYDDVLSANDIYLADYDLRLDEDELSFDNNPLDENESSLNQNKIKEICSICLEVIEIGEWYKKIPDCQHCFHSVCIDNWLSTRPSCPVCRREVSMYESLERSLSLGHSTGESQW